MVVQHNMQAMNANRMLNVTTGSQAKSTEKLSSGYKINRAADDAAGLTISEKMRKQMKGLDRASTNAEDGVSAVQTAEGALTEVHSMLQRMNELAVQASNGTNSESDRDAIQAEVEQLTTEIDRVSETTKFNEIYLLKGDPAGSTSDVKLAAHDAGLAGKLKDNGNGSYEFVLDKALKDGDKVTIAGKEYTIGAGSNTEPADASGKLVDVKYLNTSTDGYKKVDDNLFKAATTLQAGDSVTHDGNTYTLVDKIGVDDLGAIAANDTFQIGETVYTVGAQAADPAVIAPGGKTATVGADHALEEIKKALAEGKQVTLGGTVGISVDQITAGTAVNAASKVKSGITVVASLGEGEISTAKFAAVTSETLLKAAMTEGKGTTVALAAAPAFAAGDSVTKDGVTVVATSETPTAALDIYKQIDALTNGSTVSIGVGPDQKTYTIVDEADVDAELGKLTKEAILGKIFDGETVSVNGGAAATVIGNIGAPEVSDTNVISVKEAYAKMAKELQDASSIGTDKAASVKDNGNATFTITQGSVEVKNALSFSLHVGADADMTNKISVDIDSMSAAGLGIKGINVSDISGASATYAIDAIADAIQKVSEQRSALGAVQNRLEHTIANLDNVVENTTAAESRIRDTDMAEEMVEYSKNNILAQAGQSMLAQANQVNQGVLSLLG